MSPSYIITTKAHIHIRSRYRRNFIAFTASSPRRHTAKKLLHRALRPVYPTLCASTISSCFYWSCRSPLTTKLQVRVGERRRTQLLERSCRELRLLFHNYISVLLRCHRFRCSSLATRLSLLLLEIQLSGTRFPRKLAFSFPRGVFRTQAVLLH